MTVDKDYKTITFWESTNARSFSMNNRVMSPEDLQKYLNKEEVDKTVLKMSHVEEEDKEIVNEFQFDEEDLDASEESDEAEMIDGKEQARQN